jgi:MYXO-CTERM domain-containing protein
MRRLSLPFSNHASALVSLAVLAVATLSTDVAGAITRDEVMVRARAFAYHPWRCTQSNLTASCSSTYKSVYTPGDYVGLPYDWGGYMNKFTFDQGIANGLGAGSVPYGDILSCTVGLDCSGYVSQCWDTGHLTTSSLHTQSTAITQSQLLPGDALNQAGYHVILYSHTLANGEPVLYEAVGYNVHINPWGGWAYTSGYQPRRYNGITGTTAGNPIGTPDNPIPITSFPFTDSRDTKQSSSDVLDRCGAAPNTAESGPEYVYEVTFTQPGQLTVSVSDDTGVDIDVHLYTSMNTSDCIARHDSAFTTTVDCGTYYIVADTFGTGLTNAGPYTLNASFVPSGGACGSGPPAYDPKGHVGEPCAFPGKEHLPFCNGNLGGDVCIYTSGTSPISFCSHACKTAADCAEFPGGCCKTLGSGDSYCLIASQCGTTVVDAGTDGSTLDGSTLDGSTTDSSPPQDGAVLDSTPQTDGSVAPDSTVEPDAQIQTDSGVGSDGGVGFDVQVEPAVPEGGQNPAETSDTEDDGCACRAGRPAGSFPAAFAALGMALLLLRRRRSS